MTASAGVHELLQPGRIVGARYTVKRLVARGPASALYEAMTAPSREILLEVFAPDTAVAVDVETRLAHLVASVNALPASIVLPIVEASIDRESGCPFIASEASVTPSLAELVKLCPLASEELAAFIGRLCIALDAAHARGLVHAALDPARVFVGPAPRCDVRLAGLGTAFLRGHLCDPIWSAPEAYAPTPSSDVYSAALLALFATTGALPSDPASLVSSVARDIVSTGPPAPALDRRLAGPLARALAPAAGERHASAGELGKAISDALGSKFVVSSTWQAAAPAEPAAPATAASPGAPQPPPLPPRPAPLPPPLPPAATSVDALTTPVGSPSPIPARGAVPTVRLRASRAKTLVAIAAAFGVLVIIGVVSAAVGTKKRGATPVASASPSASVKKVAATAPATATTVAANAPPPVVTAPPPAPAPDPAPAPVADPEPTEPPTAKPTPPPAPPSASEATLVVECTPECASITVDGEPIESTANLKPGAHVIVVKRGLHAPQTKYVKLTAGRTLTVSFIWWKTPPGPPKGFGGGKKPCGKFLQRCD